MFRKRKNTIPRRISVSVFEDFDEVMDYAHFWNWAPDWSVAKEIYRKFPDSYSILTPFAYSYLLWTFLMTSPRQNGIMQ